MVTRPSPFQLYEYITNHVYILFTILNSVEPIRGSRPSHQSWPVDIYFNWKATNEKKSNQGINKTHWSILPLLKNKSLISSRYVIIIQRLQGEEKSCHRKKSSALSQEFEASNSLKINFLFMDILIIYLTVSIIINIIITVCRMALHSLGLCLK